ncbi:MAG: type I pullulanase [Beduini sp.]
MEPYKYIMEAYLDRFNLIKVKVSTQYYQGKIKYFYLKNASTNINLTARIIYKREFENEGYNLYHLMVENVCLGEEYFIVNNYGMSVPVINYGIVNDPMFDRMFLYDGNDLGPNYTPYKTTFKVWAPTASKVKIEYILNNQTYTINMRRLPTSGIFEASIKGDLEGVSYVYLVKHAQHYEQATDPYAYSSTINGMRSVVIDLAKIKQLPKKPLPPLKQKTDAMIYEMSVRDYTIAKNSNVTHRGLFLGLCERGTKTSLKQPTGLDYLVDLGITHVQLMPIADFATVDEQDPDLLYNWGYDPLQYNVPEGSYSTNPNDPYCRIQECVDMIESFHDKNIRVIMDVVYNHVFDMNTHAFEKLVPHYYFRNDDDGVLSNGSFCGNDLNTASFMVRKYIIDMCKRWQELYQIDGLRFDLMGVIDITTINEVEKICKKTDSNFLVYGEGWNLPTMLPDDYKATMLNHQKMVNISFFNDRFRDSIKGTSKADLGYLLGNDAKIFDVMQRMKNTEQFTLPEQSINYVECHDNATIFDHMEMMIIENDEIRQRRQKMYNTIVMLSQGIPFIHSGQEFCRTKLCHSNSYNLPVEINQIDWDYKDTFLNQVEFMKLLIHLRKTNLGFRYSQIKDIEEYIRIGHIDNSVIVYDVKQNDGEFKQLSIIINPTYNKYLHQLDDEELIYYSIDENYEINQTVLSVAPVSMYILVKLM